MSARVGVFHAPYGAATLQEIYRAANGDSEVVMIFREEVAAANRDLVAAARRVFEVAVVPGEASVTALSRLKLDGVTAFHDQELDFVDAVAATLNLPSAPKLAQPWDKYVQRRTLRTHGVSEVRAIAVESPSDFQAAVDELGQPCVLKPRRAAGGHGIAFVDNAEDMAYQLAKRQSWSGLLLESAVPPSVHPSGIDWLADYVSVETVSEGSQRHHVAIFDKTPVSVVRRAGESGADSVTTTGDLTPSRLPDPIRTLVLQRVSAALDALDVRWRVTHTEVWVRPDGAEIIEVNGRVGGHLTRLLRLIGGANLIHSALRVAAGRPPEIVTGPVRGYAAGLFPPFPQRGGRVSAGVRKSDLRLLPGVVGVDEVAEQGSPRQVNGFRVANMTLFAPDAQTFGHDVRAAMCGTATLFAEDGLTSDPWFERFERFALPAGKGAT